MARFGIFTLEDDATNVDPVVAVVDPTATTEITAALQEDAAEVAEATADIAVDTEVVDQNMEAVAEGENVVDTIQVAVDNNGEGLTPETIAVAEDHIASIYRRLGAKPARVFPAIENFAGARANKVYHAKMALEGISDTLKKAWEQIKAFFASLVTKVVEWFKNLVQNFDRLAAAAKAMQEKTKWVLDATGLKLKKDVSLKLQLLGLPATTAKPLTSQAKQELTGAGLKTLAGELKAWGDAKSEQVSAPDFKAIETAFMSAMTKAKGSDGAGAVEALGEQKGVFGVVDSSAAASKAESKMVASASFGYSDSTVVSFARLTDAKSVEITTRTVVKSTSATAVVIKAKGEEKLDDAVVTAVKAMFAPENFAKYEAGIKAHKDTTKEIPSTTKLFGEFGSGDFKNDEDGANYRVALNFAKAYTQVVNAQIAAATTSRAAAYAGFKNLLVNIGAIAGVLAKDEAAAK